MEQRIDKLERQCRWYRNLFVLLGLMLVALVTWGATKPIPDVIKARRFEVVNKDGARVAVLESWILGGAFVIYNNKGESTFAVLQTNDGSGLVRTLSRTGKTLVEITAAEDDRGLMVTYGKTGKQLVLIAASENGGLISVRNKTGEVAVTLGVDDYGNGKVGAWNRKGKGRSLKPGPQ